MPTGQRRNVAGDISRLRDVFRDIPEERIRDVLQKERNDELRAAAALGR
eukprot:gene5187-1323_t